jgi:hypothetical protein
MQRKAQLSVVVSRTTSELLERHVRATGVKKGRVSTEDLFKRSSALVSAVQFGRRLASTLAFEGLPSEGPLIEAAVFSDTILLYTPGVNPQPSRRS